MDWADGALAGCVASLWGAGVLAGRVASLWGMGVLVGGALVEGALAAPAPLVGIINTCPTLTRSGLLIPLAWIKAETETPYRAAMVERYSPDWTVWVWPTPWAKETSGRTENADISRMIIRSVRIGSVAAGAAALSIRCRTFIGCPDCLG